MRHERTEQDERAPEPTAERPPAPAPPSQEILLRLQRTAGNAAVQRLLQRQPVAEQAPPPAQQRRFAGEFQSSADGKELASRTAQRMRRTQ